MPARKNPVRNLKNNIWSELMAGILIPRLKSAAKIELIKKTLDGDKRSETVKIANTKVPVMKPVCIVLVIWAKKSGPGWSSFTMSVIIELPANQSEVQKNCEITMSGKIFLTRLIL